MDLPRYSAPASRVRRFRTRRCLTSPARSWLALYDEAPNEKVARVIAANDFTIPWEELTSETRATYLGIASAVIAAITEGEE